ncbi:unnamed protein product [Sphagnum compactum]
MPQFSRKAEEFKTMSLSDRNSEVLPSAHTPPAKTFMREESTSSSQSSKRNSPNTAGRSSLNRNSSDKTMDSQKEEVGHNHGQGRERRDSFDGAITTIGTNTPLSSPSTPLNTPVVARDVAECKKRWNTSSSVLPIINTLSCHTSSPGVAYSSPYIVLTDSECKDNSSYINTPPPDGNLRNQKSFPRGDSRLLSMGSGIGLVRKSMNDLKKSYEEEIYNSNTSTVSATVNPYLKVTRPQMRLSLQSEESSALFSMRHSRQLELNKVNSGRSFMSDDSQLYNSSTLPSPMPSPRTHSRKMSLNVPPGAKTAPIPLAAVGPPIVHAYTKEHKDPLMNLTGSEDFSTMSAIYHVAKHYAAEGKYDLAEANFAKYLYYLRREHGGNVESSAPVLEDLGHMYLAQDRKADAYKAYHSARLVRKNHCNLETREYIEDLRQSCRLKDVLYAQTQQNITSYRQLINLERKVKGENHPDISTSLQELGHFHMKLKNYAEAEFSFKEAVTLSLRVYGQQNEKTIDAQVNLGLSLKSLHKYKQYEELYSDIVQASIHLEGVRHEQTLFYMSELASTYNRAHHVEDSLRLYEKCVEVSRQVYGTGAREVSQYIQNAMNY